MAQSGTPRDDEAGLEQEGIWDSPDGAPVADAPGGAAVPNSLAGSITSTARTPGPAGLFYADVPNRIMGLIIDIIALSVSGFVLANLFGGLVTEPGALDDPGGELDVAAFVVVLVLQALISFAYFVGLWTYGRATLGMRLLGMRIGDEVGGGPVGLGSSAIRWLILGLPALLTSMAVYVDNTIGLILTALGLVWLLLLLYTMAQSPTRQGLHDRYAHTILVRVRRRAS